MSYIKHHKQLEFYHNYVWDKCSYSAFFARIHQQWLSYEEAIKPETLKWKHNIKTKYDEEWRVCVKCLEYKTRDKFHKNRVWLHNRTSDCINCRNKAKREYRKRTNYQKDHEYKKRRRTLEIWTIIVMEKERYIDWLPREDKYIVEKYEFKKWYMIKSLIDWIYKWIDLNDNWTRPRFYFNNLIDETKKEKNS